MGLELTIVKFGRSTHAPCMSVNAKIRGLHHHGALRRALLDAVADIVVECGPEAVSLRECARRAGVSHSAATPHFGDLRGLLTAFAAESFDRLRVNMLQAVAALPADAPAAEVFMATGRGYLAFARRHPGHFRLMFRNDHFAPADPVLVAAQDATFSPLADIMARLAPAAADRALRARLALAWSAVHGFAALRAEGAEGELWQPDGRADEVAEDLLALVAKACVD